MARKIVELPVTSTIDDDDNILIYDTVTQELSRITPTDLVTGGSGELNVQSDWDETDTMSDAYILNKPQVICIPELSEDSFIIQEPSAQGFGNAITITFGAGATSADGNIGLNAGGILTVNTTLIDDYFTDIQIRIARDTTAGEAQMLAWQEVSTDGGTVWNQTPGSHTQATVLGSSDTAVFRELAHARIPAGTVGGTKFRFRFARWDSGANEGKLLPQVMSGTFTSLEDVPSASIVIKRTVLQ